MRKFILIALLIMPSVILGAESQFYFVGKTVVSNDPAPNARHVYLRWDVVEGQLPADVVAFRLIRNGEKLLGEWRTNAVMDPAAIADLYRGADHQRRKLETITRLNELASDQGLAFSASQFSKTLYELIDPASDATYNPLWAFLGSRTDFNIARARYHGWIDTAPVADDGSNFAKYELLGVNASDVTVRLGYVEIDPTIQQQSIAASGFKQIRISDWRCDLPEGSKDQFTVMLDWNSPGAKVISDRVAAQSYISGFDLYRSTKNLAPVDNVAPVLDIAALAAAASNDSRGRPQIADLEKVNVPLIIDSGAPSTDPEWLEARQYHIERLGGEDQLPAIPRQNIPVEGKWLEARDQLMRAGLKPGDRRAYYLVPRDFTGNYGPTVATVVEVPLMTRPPAPWNLRAFADQTSSALNLGADALTFTWDEVNLDNYIKMYQGTRLFCNTVEARTSGVLEYVPIGGSCATTPHNAIRLDVRDYRIYRFENFDIAGRFKDSDGDGVEDSHETPDFDNNGRVDAFERSAGLQCDTNQQPAGSDPFNYLVYSSTGGSVALGRPSLIDPSAPAIARMRDTVPAGNKDTVYWYRIVSEATTPFPFGRLSFMSAPQRGLFPDRTPPPEPIVEVTKPGDNILGCEVIGDPDAPWSFDENVSDPKDTFSLSCSAGAYRAADVAKAAKSGEGACPQIVSDCGAAQPVFIQFPASDRTGGKACTQPVPDGISFCESGGVRVQPAYEQFDAEAGDLVAGGARVTVRPPNNKTCIALYENIEGTATRIGSTCDIGGLSYIPRPGLFCGYAVATDENNNISTTVQFPCTITPSQPKAPSPPQILTLDVDNALARFTIRLPAEQVAMTLARLDHDGGSGDSTRVIESIPVIDNEAGESISGTISVEALQVTKDTFCLSVLAVGQDDGTGNASHSDWSSARCFTRTATGEDVPKYLPWPAVQGATEGDPLEAALVTNYHNYNPFLAFKLGESTDLVQDGTQLTDCFVQPPVPEPPIRQDNYPYHCFDDGHVRFQSFMESELRFILYRQRRVMGGVASNWVQVSPLIDYVHFDRQLLDLNLDSGLVTLWTLNDPYVKAALDVEDPTILDVWFVDQYPFQSSVDSANVQLYEWRYQAVYFDAEHRPVKWRVSDWFREGRL